ncbi:MAG: phosphoribosylglycinamide formyltransferase [Thermoleophilia bacterium]
MFRVAVLASGSGSNLQALIDKLHRKVADIEIALVLSDRPGALALERAERADIPTAVFPPDAYPTREAHDLALAEAVETADVSLVVLAGYMRLLGPAFLDRFPWRVINLHPALLPSFPGVDGIGDAIRYGVKVTGVTVHFVDQGVDTGPIIRQECLPVHDRDTVTSLAERIHALEHRVLPRTVELMATGRVKPPRPGERRVFVDDSAPGFVEGQDFGR